jgi:rod shape-determining protein MreB
VLSLGGIVCSQSLRVGGDRFDEAIVRYIRREFSLMVGERTGEEIKIEIGTAHPRGTTEKTIQIKGRDLISGLPKAVTISSTQIYTAIQEVLEAVVGAVKQVLEHTPPELAADIVNKGIVMTGGGSLFDGMDRLLSQETGLPVFVADDPLSCVALGTGRALSMLHALPQQKQRRVVW